MNVNVVIWPSTLIAVQNSHKVWRSVSFLLVGNRPIVTYPHFLWITIGKRGWRPINIGRFLYCSNFELGGLLSRPSLSVQIQARTACNALSYRHGLRSWRFLQNPIWQVIYLLRSLERYLSDIILVSKYSLERCPQKPPINYRIYIGNYRRVYNLLNTNYFLAFTSTVYA